VAGGGTALCPLLRHAGQRDISCLAWRPCCAGELGKGYYEESCFTSPIYGLGEGGVGLNVRVMAMATAMVRVRFIILKDIFCDNMADFESGVP
jgi:hypothetical protein